MDEVTGASPRPGVFRYSLRVFVRTLMVVLFTVTALTGCHQRQGKARFATEAIPGKGVVTSLWIAPNGVTHRLNYTVTAEDGSTGTRNVQIDPDYWATLEEGQEIDVMYLPDDPYISRLAFGDSGDADMQIKPSFLAIILAEVVAMAGVGYYRRPWKKSSLDAHSGGYD